MKNVEYFIDYESSPLETAKRFAQVIPAGLALTLLLVLAMERLIYSEPIDVEEVMVRPIPDPVIDSREPEPIRREKPVKPEEPEVVPELPPTQFTPQQEQGVVPLGPLDSGGGIKATLGEYASSAPIATVLVQPQYPARALSRGIEGYVDVRFDVTAAGTTNNIQVLQAMPTNYFETAAIKAVKSWKFQPVRINGSAVPYSGVEQRITFQMQKSF